MSYTWRLSGRNKLSQRDHITRTDMTCSLRYALCNFTEAFKAIHQKQQENSRVKVNDITSNAYKVLD